MTPRPHQARDDAEDLPEEILELARLLADVAAAEQTAAQPAPTRDAADR